MASRVIFVDVDTQFDFMDPAGALYVPGAEKLSGRLAALVAFAAAKGIPHLATLDTHTPDDPEFAAFNFPPHCVRGTAGWLKVEATSQHAPLPVKDAGDDVVARRELLFHKATFDVFETPAFAPVVKRLGATEAVVFGVATDYCVKAAVLGLLGLGLAVTVVEDAVAAVAPETGEAAVAEMKAAGARFAKAAEVMAAIEGQAAHVA